MNWWGKSAFFSHCFVLDLFRTKIFIRHPKTLFATEDAFELCKHDLGGLSFCLFIKAINTDFYSYKTVKKLFTATATRIQAKYKGYRAKGDYLKQREAGEYLSFVLFACFIQITAIFKESCGP